MVVDTFEIGSIERVRLMKLEGWKLFRLENSDEFEYRHPDGRVVGDVIFTIPDHVFDIVIHPTPKSDLPPFDPIAREDAWLRDRRENSYPI